MNSTPRRILLTQLRRLGDVLMTTPAVRAVRRAYPDARITFLTEPPADQLFAASPYVDEIITVSAKPTLGEKLALLKTLRSKKFDLAIDFFSNNRSSLYVRASGAKRRIGIAGSGRKLFFTDTVNTHGPHYAAAGKLRLLEPLGIPDDGIELDFFVDEAAKEYARRQLEELGVDPEADFMVSLSPVSRQPYKVWPAKRFAAVADWLIETYGAKILFVHGPGEEPFVDAVRVAMTRDALPPYPVPNLVQTTALFELMDLHVGNDNGPMHFAIAARTPTVAIFGRPKARNWTPPDSDRHRAVENFIECKLACTWPECGLECIEGIGVEPVKRAVREQIETWELA